MATPSENIGREVVVGAKCLLVELAELSLRVTNTILDVIHVFSVSLGREAKFSTVGMRRKYYAVTYRSTQPSIPTG